MFVDDDVGSHPAGSPRCSTRPPATLAPRFSRDRSERAWRARRRVPAAARGLRSRRSTSDPRTRERVRLGGQHGDPPRRAGAESARSTRRSRAAAMSRSGRIASPPPAPGSGATAMYVAGAAVDHRRTGRRHAPGSARPHGPRPRQGRSPTRYAQRGGALGAARARHARGLPRARRSAPVSRGARDGRA